MDLQFENKGKAFKVGACWCCSPPSDLNLNHLLLYFKKESNTIIAIPNEYQVEKEHLLDITY